MSSVYCSSGSLSEVPAAPPLPPPLPGSAGAINVPTYKETKQKNDEIKKAEAKSSIQDNQFANLPDKLMNTMKREKKPFTYTPLSVGDNGKLDLSQIKSPKMKKRLMANMKDEEEKDDSQTIESIDASLQNNKKQDDLDRELGSPISITNQQSTFQSDALKPIVQTKPSLIVPLNVLNDNYQNENSFQSKECPPPLPQRQSLEEYNFNKPLTSDEKLDSILNEQLKRNQKSDSNNNYAPSFYDWSSDMTKKEYGNIKPKKINIAKELLDERNFNCMPSQYTNDSQANKINNSNSILYNQSTNFNQLPAERSNSLNSAALDEAYSIPNKIERDSSQYYSNSQIDYPKIIDKASNAYKNPISEQIYQIPIINQNDIQMKTKNEQKIYQIPIINQNSIQTRTGPPPPPQRQQSLNRSYKEEKDIPVQSEEPIQSRSFKILQKLTADIEDEINKLSVLDQQNKVFRDPLEDKLPAYFGTLNHIEEPRLRSERRIPIQIEEHYKPSQPEYHSKSEQTWYSNHQSSSSNSDASLPGSFWSSPINWSSQTPATEIPASKQPQIASPPRYQGSNIPSRSFRLLQMLTNAEEW